MLQTIITEQTLCINLGNHTTILNERNISFIEKKYLIDRVKALKANCKKHGVKLKGASKILSFIEENFNGYHSEFVKYQETFTKLFTQAQKLTNLPLEAILHAEETKQAIETRNALNAMQWRSTLLSKFGEIEFRLSQYDGDLSRYDMLNIG